MHFWLTQQSALDFSVLLLLQNLHFSQLFVVVGLLHNWTTSRMCLAVKCRLFVCVLCVSVYLCNAESRTVIQKLGKLRKLQHKQTVTKLVFHFNANSTRIVKGFKDKVSIAFKSISYWILKPIVLSVHLLPLCCIFKIALLYRLVRVLFAFDSSSSLSLWDRVPCSLAFLIS